MRLAILALMLSAASAAHAERRVAPIIGRPTGTLQHSKTPGHDNFICDAGGKHSCRPTGTQQPLHDGVS
jgi:hypothetical protein